VSHLVFFLVFSAIWAAADHFIAPPIARLIAMVRGGGPKAGAAEVAAGAGTAPSGSDGDDAASTTTMDGLEDQQAQSLARFEAVNLGIAECLVGIGLGFIAGLLGGRWVLAVSFTSSAWSWIATICLIIASFIGMILHHLLGWLLYQFS
jgi:hypothetical protein